MTELKKRGIKCDDAMKANGILEADKFAKGDGNLQLAVKTNKLRQRGIMCDDATKAQSILCSMGEGNFQLAAKTELRQRGIMCDDATKAQSILCSMGEGNFQLAAKTELRQRGIICDNATCNQGAEYSGGHQVCQGRRQFSAGRKDGAAPTKNRV